MQNILIILILFTLKNAQAQNQNQVDGTIDKNFHFSSNFSSDVMTMRDGHGRLFPFLAVIKLPNSICNYNGEQGACTTRKQCLNDGGIILGQNCGSGFGVCCMVTKSCSAFNNGQLIKVTSSGTHLTSPGVYQAPIQCQFTITKKPGVCQVRLDFINFLLSPPDQQGDCSMDVMTVTGADNLVNFMTCGNATGQHLYLHYVTAETITINLNLNTNNAIYDILVTFIECRGQGLPLKRNFKGRKLIRTTTPSSLVNDNFIPVEAAPFGCTQYYTKGSDMVQSFNYRQVDIQTNMMTHQINNQQYSVCIKSTYGSKKITWQPCYDQNSFFVSGSIPPTLNYSTCPNDYLDIPGSTIGRFCGSKFPIVDASQTKPYMMYVNFDEKEFLGLDVPLDPATGCCAGFCTCVDVFQQSLPPAVPPNPAPCDPGVIQGAHCVANDFLINNSDFHNIGFCLRYTLS